MWDTPKAPLARSIRPETPIAGCQVQNPYSNLCVPTQITKIGADYFLVDCYHDRILTTTSLSTPLNEWMVLSDEINKGHTIAGNGTVYLADDTENHRVLIYEKTEDGFALTQYFENIGVRPHYVAYHEDTERFYVLSSNSGEVYVFYQEKDSTDVCLEKIMTIPGMADTYIRSFTLDGNNIYFAASNGTILLAKLKDFSIIRQWNIPPEIAGLVQVQKIRDYYYLTVSTDISGDGSKATILRTDDLSGLIDYEYELIYDRFASDGTPYYISFFDGHYYMTQHCNFPGHGVWQFDITDNELVDITALYP